MSEPDRPIVAGDMYQSRVRKKRQGEGLHHVEQLFEGNDRRQLLGEAGQELERVIRSLQRVGALFHAFFQLGLRLQQALLVAAERPLRNDSLGDVEGVPEHVKCAVWRLGQHVAIQPDSMLSAPRLHAHEALIAALLANPAKVVVELVAPVRREKVAQVAADAVGRLITERLGRSRVDGQNRPDQVVRTNQAEAVFDEITVATFAVTERVVDAPPGGSQAFECGGIRSG